MQIVGGLDFLNKNKKNINRICFKFSSIVLAVFSTFILSSCIYFNPNGDNGGGNGSGNNNGGTDDNVLSKYKYSESIEKIADFSLGQSNDYVASNSYSNGGMFNCTWRSKCITYKNEKMQMSIDYDWNNTSYAGSEIKSYWNEFKFGYYAVCMKPIKLSGVVSSFFTYTGKNDGNPHDEIDIEFLGKDTTKVQFNYYTNGVGGNEVWYDLGFDASEDFHEYAFMWTSKEIVWFVDKIPVCVKTENLPTHNSRLFANAWNGKENMTLDWLGAFDATLPATAEYKWFAYEYLAE